MLKSENFKCAKLEEIVKSQLEQKSKCTRTSSVLELKFSGILTKIEGRREVDVGKSVLNPQCFKNWIDD